MFLKFSEPWSLALKWREKLYMGSFIQSSQLLKAGYHHPPPPVLHVTLNLRVVNYLTQEVSLLFIGKRLGPCACI